MLMFGMMRMQKQNHRLDHLVGTGGAPQEVIVIARVQGIEALLVGEVIILDHDIEVPRTVVAAIARVGGIVPDSHHPFRR